MDRRIAAAAAVGIAGVLAGAVAIWSAESNSARPPVPAAAAPTPARPSAAVSQSAVIAGPCQFRVGEGAIYSGHDQLRGTVDLAGLHALMSSGHAEPEAAGSAIDQQTHWQAHTRVVRANADGGSVLAVRFASVTGTQLAAGELQQTLLLRLNKRCHIEQFGWRNSADRAVVRLLQGVLATLDFQLPEPAVAGRTVGTASDVRGTYEYRMLLGQTEDGLTLVRRKIRYHPVKNAKGTMEMDQGVSGDGLTVQLRNGGWFETASVSESATFGSSGAQFSRLQVSAQAKREPGQAEAGAVDLDDGSWQWGTLLGQVDPQPPKADPALAALSLDELGKQLDELIRTGQDGPRSVLLMTAWLQAHPEAIAAVKQWLREHGGTDPASRARARQWLAALGQSGLAAARAALRELAMAKGYYEPLRGAAAFALATATGFDGSDMAGLLELSRERGWADAQDPWAKHAAAVGTAMLGTAAHEVQDAQPALAEQAKAELAMLLAKEKDKALLKAAIDGAGNSGDPQLMAALQPYFASEDTELRNEAASALRLMPLEASAPVFVQRMDAETHDNVLEQLIHAVCAQLTIAQVPPPDTVVASALAHYGGKHGNPVEFELTHLLGEAAASHAAAKQALQARFASEIAKGPAANLQVLRMIGMYLSSAELQGAKVP